MKKIKFLFLIMAVAAISGLFVHCQKDNNEPLPIDKEVAFVINVPNRGGGGKLKNTMDYSLADADKIILTIQNIDGSPTKYTSSEVKIQQMDGNFYTKKIILKTGVYKITEFLILNAGDSTIYATPVLGSQEAQNVANPLPIEFTVAKDIATVVSIEVLSTQNKKPEDFGLSSFPIIVVKTFGFMLGVTDNESDEFLAAKLTLSNGTYAYIQNLEAVSNNVVTVKDGLSSYTLTIEKTGYDTYNHTFSSDSIKMFANSSGNLPLLIELKLSPKVIEQYTSDANTVILDHFNNATVATSVYGSPGYTQGVNGLGEAMQYALGQYAKYDYTGWSGASGGTLEFWIKPESYNLGMFDMNWNNTTSLPSAGHILHFQINATGNIVVGVWGGANTMPASTNVIQLNEWSHLAYVWGPSGTYLYMNGQLEASVPDNCYPSMIGATYLYLNYWGGAGFGLIDELRLSNKARSVDELNY